MSNSEYRIDWTSSPNDLEQMETLGEEILHQIESSHPPPPTTTAPAAAGTGAGAGVAAGLAERTARAGMYDDHLHQIIHFCKDNFTSTFPFAWILIFKGFDKHSAGQFTLVFRRSSHLSSLVGIFMVIFFSAQSLSWKLCFCSSSLVESQSPSIVDHRTTETSLRLL